MLALVRPVEETDGGTVPRSLAKDLVLALAQLVASTAWDEEVDGRARTIVAGLYQASVSGQPEARD